MKKELKKKGNIGLILLSIFTVAYMCVYLIWRAFYTIPDVKEYGWVAFVAGICLLAAEAISAVEAFVHYADLNSNAEPPMPVIPEDWYPEVDVFIATHNEEEDILFKTANACTYMRYPDKSKVHIYLCDDGNRENVKALADRLGVGYIGMADNKEAKAGNLNNALRQTHSPLIVTFDADMIPNSEFLLETVPYFFLPVMKQDENGNWVEKTEEEKKESKKIGFIQTPQSFYNPDLFQYNLFAENEIPNEQDYFFRKVNIGKNSSNSPIYAGSNTVISREALEEVGGICTGTITEDFETGLLIEMAGYQCYAVDKLLAKGLAPITFVSLIKQRERWARGCIYSLRRRHLVLNPKIPFKMKIGYGACRIYWGSFTRRAIYIMAPILFILLNIPVVICGLKELLLIWLPTYILYGITLKKTSGSIRNSRWSNIIDTIMFPYLILPIAAEVLGIRKKEFSVTSKSRQQDDTSGWIAALPHICILVLSGIALILGLRDILLYQQLGAMVVVYWLCVNVTSLAMAVFFMMGRKNVRTSERFYNHVKVNIEYQGKSYEGMSTDISEGGMAVELAQAVYLPYKEGDDAELTVRDGDYCAHLQGRIVSVQKRDANWKYCIRLEELDEDAKREYMQIIYDREHTLPKEISPKSSVFGDFAMILDKKAKGVYELQRKTARIEVEKSFQTTGGDTVVIKNFNFVYVLLEGNASLGDEIEIILEKDLIMKCSREKDKGTSLYAIQNLEELMQEDAFIECVNQWNENGKA